MKTIDIIVSADGAKVEMDAKNFEGTECKDFMGSIMKELGTVLEEKKKPEFYVAPKQKLSIR